MVHIIPSAIKRTLSSHNDDVFDLDGVEYESCFDENGIGEWKVSGSTNFDINNNEVRLLSSAGDAPLIGGLVVEQRADIFISNRGCSQSSYTISLNGLIETFASGFERLRIRENGNEIGFIMSDDDDGVDPDGDPTTVGKTVTRSFQISVDASPCPTLISVHTSTWDNMRNYTTQGNVFYKIRIEKNQ